MAETCKITRYTCPANAKNITRLAANANAQQATNSGFAKEIFPWKSLCDKGDYLHYVARDSSGIICGWLTAVMKVFEGQKYMYLVEIGTRRIKDHLYGGIGQKLHRALVVDSLAMKCAFIYLYPLDATAAAIYKTDNWAYIQLRSDVPHLFKILTGAPSHALLATLLPPGPKDIIERAKDIAKEGVEDVALLSRINAAEARLLKDAEKIEDLDHFLDFMEMNDLPMKTQRAKLWHYFSEYLGL